MGKVLVNFDMIIPCNRGVLELGEVKVCEGDVGTGGKNGINIEGMKPCIRKIRAVGGGDKRLMGLVRKYMSDKINFYKTLPLSHPPSIWKGAKVSDFLHFQNGCYYQRIIRKQGIVVLKKPRKGQQGQGIEIDPIKGSRFIILPYDDVISLLEEDCLYQIYIDTSSYNTHYSYRTVVLYDGATHTAEVCRIFGRKGPNPIANFHTGSTLFEVTNEDIRETLERKGVETCLLFFERVLHPDWENEFNVL